MLVEVIDCNIRGWMCERAKQYQGLANQHNENRVGLNVARYGIVCDAEQRSFCTNDSQCSIVWDASMTKKGKELGISQEDIDNALNECTLVGVVVTPAIELSTKILKILEGEDSKKLQVFGRKVQQNEEGNNN